MKSFSRLRHNRATPFAFWCTTLVRPNLPRSGCWMEHVGWDYITIPSERWSVGIGWQRTSELSPIICWWVGFLSFFKLLLQCFLWCLFFAALLTVRGARRDKQVELNSSLFELRPEKLSFNHTNQHMYDNQQSSSTYSTDRQIYAFNFFSNIHTESFL